MSPPVNPSSRLRTAFAAVVAAAGFLAASPRASADTIKLHFDSTALAATKSNAVSVTLSTPAATVSGAIPGPYYWHEIGTSPNYTFPNPTTTFCVELTQHISTGNTYTYTTYSVTQGLTNAGLTSAQAAAQATAISELYAAHYSAAVGNIGDTSTAFQLALWALRYDTDGNYNLTTTNLPPGGTVGDLNVTSASANAISTAQGWLNGLSSVSASTVSNFLANNQLVWLNSSSNQDQIAVIPCTPTTPTPPAGVPAPPGVLLGLIGLGGCVFGRGFRRRTATAATA